MKKLVISVATIALISSVSFADENTNADTNQTNSGISFKGLASKTYNFLGIQTKEDNQKAFETIIADTNAIKIQQQEYVKQVSKTLEEYKTAIESLKKENISLKESNDSLKKEIGMGLEKASNEIKQISSALSIKQNSADSKLQDEKITELKKEVIDLKDEIKFLKNLLNETLKSSKIQQN